MQAAHVAATGTTNGILTNIQQQYGQQPVAYHLVASPQPQPTPTWAEKEQLRPSPNDPNYRARGKLPY